MTYMFRSSLDYSYEPPKPRQKLHENAIFHVSFLRKKNGCVATVFVHCFQRIIFQSHCWADETKFFHIFMENCTARQPGEEKKNPENKATNIDGCSALTHIPLPLSSISPVPCCLSQFLCRAVVCHATFSNIHNARIRMNWEKYVF